MKRYLLPLIATVLLGCGPSEKERNQIATITCNYISETRNMDAALRLKEMNVAREKLGEEPFLGVDEDIKDAVKYGLCKELVLNDPDYSTKLLEAKKEELRLLEIALAEKRLRDEREKARKDSIAKINAEKSRQRSLAAKREIAKDQAKWRLKVGELLSDVPNSVKGNLKWDASSLKVDGPCNYFKGLSRLVTVYFKNGLGKVESTIVTGSCYSDLATFNYDLSPAQEKALKDNQSNLKNAIERITLSVIGVYDVKGFSINDSFSEEADYFPHYYKTLDYSATLADPFVYEIQF